MFHFKKFDLEHERSTLKIGTDAVLLATLAGISGCRTVLDVGCGCGVIAFCIAQRMAENGVIPQITGIDIDGNSVEESMMNAANFGLVPESNFSFRKVSLQEFSDSCPPSRFDLIVCNPPFYHNDLKPSDCKKLLSRHGDGSLEFAEIVSSALKLLPPGGRLAVILPKRESNEFITAANGKLFCISQIEIKPTASKPVYRVVMEFSQTVSDIRENSFSIRDENLQYTDEYLQLVNDFLTLR